VAPSKVIAFSWQLILNRGIQCDEGMVCPLCNSTAETACRLLLRCRIAATVWYEIVRWVGQNLMLPPTVCHSFSMFVGSGARKKGKK
jgi:hypothetical protein